MTKELKASGTPGIVIDTGTTIQYVRELRVDLGAGGGEHRHISKGPTTPPANPPTHPSRYLPASLLANLQDKVKDYVAEKGGGELPAGFFAGTEGLTACVGGPG